MREAAAKLAAIIPRERLDAAVVAWAEAAPRRGTWGVAFSGGPDSLALLLLLWAHWPARRRSLRVLHFDHRMRGKESTRDAAFSRKVGAKLGVKLTVGRWPGDHRAASEAEARAARMAFLKTHARVLWFGHQMDDIAETMLMRLARGSGTGGLAAPRPVHQHGTQQVHLRPLLGLKKGEIIAALSEVGVSWREDATNTKSAFFRNRVRAKVIAPWVEASHRDALTGAARSRQLLEEDDSALEAWLDELQPLSRGGVLDLCNLHGKPRAVLRRALHRWILAQPKIGDLSRQAFDLLLEAIEQRRETRQSVGTAGFAVTDGKRLRFENIGKPRRKFQRRAN